MSLPAPFAPVVVAPTYNNMEVTAQKTPRNKYWFELLRRQARNLYLNMEYGSAFDRRAWTSGPRNLWKKIRSQPMHRLPVRVARQCSLWFAQPTRDAPEGRLRGFEGNRTDASLFGTTETGVSAVEEQKTGNQTPLLPAGNTPVWLDRQRVLSRYRRGSL